MRRLLTVLFSLAIYAALVCGAYAQVGGLSFPGPGGGHSSGAACGGFTPASFGANLIAWFKDPDINTTLSGSNVTAWSDFSGNGNTIVPNFATQPTYSATGLGGKPAVIFTAANADRLITTSAVTGAGTGTAISAFMLASFTANSINGGGLGFNDSVGNALRFALALGSGTTGIRVQFAAGQGVNQPAAISTELRLGAVFDGSAATTYVNNVAGTPFSYTGVAIGPGGLLGFNMGAATSVYDGPVREFFFVNKTLNSTDLSNVDCYLQSRQ